MSKDWKEIESNYYMFVVKRQPIVIVKDIIIELEKKFEMLKSDVD